MIRFLRAMYSSVCRICLVDNEEMSMSHIQNNRLLEIYTKLTSAELNTSEGPRGVCYICRSLLQRCCRFLDMARRSEQILAQIISKGYEVSSNTITALDFRAKHIINLSTAPMQSMNQDGLEMPHSFDVAVNIEPLEVKQENSEDEELFTEKSPVLTDVDITASELIEPTAARTDTDIECCNMRLDSSKQYNEPMQKSSINHIRTEDKRYKCKHSNENHNLMAHMQIHTGENIYICDDCGACFRCKYLLVRHIETHTGVKPHTCTYCNKSFYRTTNLKVHERIHTGEKLNKCKHCDKSFIDSCKLKVHIRTHTGEKPYKCTYCNKHFSQSGTLMVHNRIHTGEKLYKCKYCNKSFYRNYALKVHERIHTGEKPYKCKHCDKSFSENSQLKLHIRTHTGEKPYKCTYCNKSFYQNCHLKEHEKIHTGEKPYKCPYCNKSFKQNGDLKVHIRIHTGEKRYKCTYCNKSFIQNGQLKSHIRTHIG